MPTVDHTELAHIAFQDTGIKSVPPLRAVEDIRPYLNKLLAYLPVIEQAGYVSAPPGGENSIYLDTGEYVRVARVMYPDGIIYKIMNDVPNGNPQWVYDDNKPELYISYQGPHEIPSDTDGDGNEDNDADYRELELRVAQLERTVRDLEEKKATKVRVEAINDNLREVDNASVKEPLPDYVGQSRLWGGPVISKPIVK